MQIAENMNDKILDGLEAIQFIILNFESDSVMHCNLLISSVSASSAFSYRKQPFAWRPKIDKKERELDEIKCQHKSA